jgi:hypothetical protein
VCVREVLDGVCGGDDLRVTLRLKVCMEHERGRLLTCAQSYGKNGCVQPLAFRERTAANFHSTSRQLLQVPTTGGEELKWVRYDASSARQRQQAYGADGRSARTDPRTGAGVGVRGDGPNQGEIDRQAAARDSVASAWKLGNRAPRSYFH